MTASFAVSTSTSATPTFIGSPGVPVMLISRQPLERGSHTRAGLSLSAAEPGDGGVHDARVLGCDLVVAQTLARQAAIAVVLQQDVRPPCQLPCQLQIFRIGQIELDRLLASVGCLEVGARVVRPRGPHCRVSSPTRGRSTLMTMAPRSASVVAASGPARTWLKSATSRPSRGLIASRHAVEARR